MADDHGEGTIDVHSCDGVSFPVDAKISPPIDLDWMAQLRYYWTPVGSIVMYGTQKPKAVDKYQFLIISSTLLYGLANLGNSVSQDGVPTTMIHCA